MKIANIAHYFGGKGSSGTYQAIINEIRPHDVLIVPFLGNCAITRYIKRSDHTIGIDASSFIIGCWKEMKYNWIELINGCGIEYLENFEPESDKRYTIYCDPPYPISSRKQMVLTYEHELSDLEHLRLLKAIKRISKLYNNVDVLISTYENTMYSKALSDWRLTTFNSTTRHGLAIEYLYMSYDNPEGVLHDYSFIGQNFRERERIKKKIKRHVSRLLQLPASERNAIIAAIAESVPAGNCINGDRIPNGNNDAGHKLNLKVKS